MCGIFVERKKVMAKAKIINLLLDDGNLEGLLTIEDSSWDGAMFVSPRESVDKLFEQDETNYWGVYLLISDEEVYIGQASELRRRIKQHNKGKDFWKRVVLITTKDDSLNRSAIDYIEHEFIQKAKKASSLNIENKQVGNKTKVSRFDKVRYDNFMENALLLLELIGIKVFARSSHPKITAKNKKEIVGTQLPIFIKSKASIDAKGIFDIETQKVTLLKKSKIANKTSESFRMQKYDSFFEDCILKENIPSLSPSTSEGIVHRSSRDGWTAWKDRDGNMLQNYRKEKI